MASPKKFSLFAQLPPELRIMIWEISILEYHRDRLVPMNEETKRIICFRILACSPHFSATWESRKVATDLYPIRLPVSRMVSTVRRIPRVVDDTIGSDISKYPPKGAIYISFERDIFVFGIDVLTSSFFDIKLRSRKRRLDGGRKFGWRSPSLSLPQCQSVKRVMLLNMIDWRELESRGHCSLHCVIRRNTMWFHNTWYDNTIFSGIQKCFYAMLDQRVMNGPTMYLNVLGTSGHLVLDALNQGNMLACFDGKDVKKYREEGKSSKCVCFAGHSQGRVDGDSR
ncbi:hypothetical protein F4782DRAFT_550155 [Xylaria castorea]|nr:hypothetical protein F4782DRAFT_550155 [Xylaria castorea]